MKEAQQLEENLFRVKELRKDNIGDSYSSHYPYHFNPEILRILANKRIIEIVKKYKPEDAREVGQGLAKTAYYLKDENVAVRAAETTGKYPGKAGAEIASWIGIASGKGKDAAVKAIDIFESDDVGNTIRKYPDEEVAGRVARTLGYLAVRLGDKDVVTEAAKVIGKYPGKDAKKVASSLLRVADLLLYDTHMKMLHYWGNIYPNAVYPADAVDGDSTVIDKMKRLITMHNVVGENMFHSVDPHKLYEILNHDWDELVKDKESFDSIIARGRYYLPQEEK